MQFGNLDRVGYGAAPGGYDRVGWGPQLVGVQSGPAIVGAAGMAGPMGPAGHIGVPGHAGPVGPMGPAGGGPMGYTGPRGPRGYGGFGAYGRNMGPWSPPGFGWSPIGYGPYGYAATTPYPYSGFPHVVNTPPTQVREFVIGFGPTVILANSTAIFQAQPQLIFRGSRLIVPSALANNFSINDIRVGKDSQAVSANPIPAAAFSELAVGVNLGLDTATPGIIITISVSNTTAAQQTFSAALIGTSMQ